MRAQCPTCTRAVGNPYRRIIDGKIVEGCIDASHTGHLVQPSSSNDWHNRKCAEDWRKKSCSLLLRGGYSRRCNRGDL